MNPGRVFAIVILLLAGALLVQGYVIPALFTAVFGVLLLVAPHVRSSGSNDEGAIGEAGASSWSSSSVDRSSADDRSDGDCDSAGDGDGGGDSGCDGGGGD